MTGERESNPYEARHAPTLPPPSLPPTRENDLANLTIVATILLPMAMVTIVLYCNSIALNAPVDMGFDIPRGNDQDNMISFRVGRFGSIALPLICQLLTIAGSIAMLARRKIRVAWVGAIVSMIPFCGPCFGLSIPLAIWAMVLLQRPAVVAAFRANVKQ